jgi:LmbE family N-acetylglucosaminyl deacetylase
MALDSSPSGKWLTRRKFLILFIALILIMASLYLFLSNLDKKTCININNIKSSDRILIFSPHPDDETIATAGIIKKALDQNATVTVVVMTDGSEGTTQKEFSQYLKKTKQNNSTSLVELRHNETLDAMSKLGLNSNNIIFLGYPDTGLKPLFEDYWDENNVYKSNLAFNNYDHSPYSFSYQPGVSYTGSNVAENLKEIIENFKPTIIITPDGWDEHSDHWATNAFVMYSAAITHFKGKIYCYITHKGCLTWPSPAIYEPGFKLSPPTEMQNLDVNWIFIPLTSNEENAKENALDSYKLPLNLTNGYLKSFIRTNELLTTHQPVEVERIYTHDFFIMGMPYTSFKDIRYDYGTKTLKTSDELSSVGLEYDNDKFYVVISAAHPINTQLVYRYHFRILKGDKIQRLDVKVENGMVEYENKSTLNVLPDEMAKIENQNNMTVLKLPLTVFKNSNFMMMSVDVSDANNQLLDSMSWRQFQLK